MVLNMTEKGLAYANPFLVKKKLKKIEKGIKYFISMSIYYTSNDRLLNENNKNNKGGMEATTFSRRNELW